MIRIALLALCAISAAQADIIPMLLGSGGVNCGVQGGTWGCEYSYTAKLHDDTKLTAKDDDYPEYFTIYDFNGYIGETAVAPGSGLWTITATNLGVTPTLIRSGAWDDPNVVNVTFRYVGASNVAAGSALGTFTLRSEFGPDVMLGRFASQVSHVMATPSGPQLIVQNTGFVDVPVPYRSDVGDVPEPLTSALMGGGLCALGLLRRFRK